MTVSGNDVSAHTAYEQAEAYVNGLIMGPPSPPPGTPVDEIRARAIARLDRLRAFLAFLGDPQQSYPTIHVAGTSGKGSTSTLTASMLTAGGYRTGLHVSPYLQVATEKLQIDGALIPAQRYATLVDAMRASVEEWVGLGNERPNYGEFWVAMTYRYFAEEAVDVAVIEVGAGGRFDVTNVIEPRVAAITSIGYDHVVTLGRTLPEIAWHKAGIIKPGAAVVTAVTDPDVLPVIDAEARLHAAPITYVKHGEAFTDVSSSNAETSFVDTASGQRFTLSLPGTFQATNAATALAICRLFDPNISNDALKRGLAAGRFPGRMEIVQHDPLVMLDGAHNTEKVGSLVENVVRMYPERRIILVFGALESKSFREMFDLLSPHVGVLIATAPQVLAKPSIDASEIGALAPDRLLVEVVPDPIASITRALELAGPADLVLVTGSLYLVGNVRRRWYPTERVLEQGTSWPVPIDESNRALRHASAGNATSRQ